MSQWKTPILAGPLANEGALLDAADHAIQEAHAQWHTQWERLLFNVPEKAPEDEG